MSASEDNEDGFWENVALSEFNDRILRRLQGSWHEPPPLHQGWESSPEVADLRQAAIRLLQETFPAVVHWGWKDPRNCLTLPFWTALHRQMRCVFVLRNPIDVARSLRVRNGFPMQKGYRLWMTYVAAGLLNTSGLPRLFIFYDDLLEAPVLFARRLAEFLGVPAATTLAENELSRAVAPTRRHHHSSIPQIMGHDTLPLECKTLFATLWLRVACAPALALDREPSEVDAVLEHLAVQLATSTWAVGDEERSKLERALAQREESFEQSETERRALADEVKQLRPRIAEVEESFRKLESDAARERARVVTHYDAVATHYKAVAAQHERELTQLRAATGEAETRQRAREE